MIGPSRARRFTAGVASVTAGSYAAIAVSFVTSIVLTRAMGATEYGHLALLLIASQFLSIFVSAWTSTALVHFGAREFAERGSLARTFWSRTVLTLPWLGVAALALAIFSSPLADFLGVPLWGIWIVFTHFVLAAAVGTASSLLQAMDRMPRYGVGLVLDRAVALVFIMALARVDALDAIRALACFVLSSAVVAAFLFASIGRRPFAPVCADAGHIAALWRFSIPIVASSWLGLLGSQFIDYLVIRRFLPLAELGLYALAYQLAGVLQQITVVVSTLMLPRYSVIALTRDDDELRRILERIVPYWLMAYAFALAISIPLAPLAIRVLFGAAFAGAVPSLLLLIVASIALAIVNTFTPLLTAHERLWPLSFVVLVSVAVNASLDLVLVPLYGINGAAAATACAYSTSAALVLLVVRRELGLRGMRYAAFAVPVVAAYVSAVTLDGVLALAVGALATAASFLGIVRVFGLRPTEDLAPLARRWRREASGRAG